MEGSAEEEAMTRLIQVFLHAMAMLMLTAALCVLVIHAMVRLGLTDAEAAGAVVAACVLVHAERVENGKRDGKETG